MILTIALISGNASVRVEQLRTFDRVELSNAVLDLVVEQHPDSGISSFSHSSLPCPASVAVKSGVKFTCAFAGEGGLKKKVPVTVKDTYSAELEIGAPTE
ncbi:DUF4333 domain-containing protein [Saccharothrix sp. HUAS TT1]|uniref:DUF4333 domain-containing protein n=1 Tax=unclassified Saccharothrix TaxID=2593673 RepID=UPI00345C26B2